MRKRLAQAVDGIVQKQLFILTPNWILAVQEIYRSISDFFCSAPPASIPRSIHNENLAFISVKSAIFHTIHMPYNNNYKFKLSNY
jgi:hypothetical protein